jgi:hypothetical protein
LAEVEMLVRIKPATEEVLNLVERGEEAPAVRRLHGRPQIWAYGLRARPQPTYAATAGYRTIQDQLDDNATPRALLNDLAICRPSALKRSSLVPVLDHMEASR